MPTRYPVTTWHRLLAGALGLSGRWLLRSLTGHFVETLGSAGGRPGSWAPRGGQRARGQRKGSSLQDDWDPHGDLPALPAMSVGGTVRRRSARRSKPVSAHQRQPTVFPAGRRRQPRQPTPVSPAGTVLGQRADPGLSSHATVSHAVQGACRQSARSVQDISMHSALTCTFASTDAQRSAVPSARLPGLTAVCLWSRFVQVRARCPHGRFKLIWAQTRRRDTRSAVSQGRMRSPWSRTHTSRPKSRSRPRPCVGGRRRRFASLPWSR